MLCIICPAQHVGAEDFSSVSLSKKSKEFKTHRLFPNKQLTAAKKDYIARFWDKSEKLYTPDIFEKTVVKDPRTIGNMIADLAVVNWAIVSERSRTVMNDWVDRAIRIDKWGNNHDLEISHLLFGLALVYDWHRDLLEPDLKARLRKFLFEHARFQFDQTQLRVTAWWTNSYWQNHFWVNYTSILASGLALAKDQPEGMYWAQSAYDKFNKSLELFSSDGSNHEGLNYSLYGNQWLVRGMAILEAYDPSMFRRTDYLKNYHHYFEAYSVDPTFQTFFDTGDSPRFLWDIAVTEIFLKLYQAYQVPIYKELYFYFLNVPSKAKPGILWCVYGELDLKTDSKTIHFNKSAYFSEDLGVFIDKQYEADEVSASFLFKSGIPGGRVAYQHMQGGHDYRLNLSHSHPDQNHFMVWVKDGFLISDTGYTTKKWTLDHNSLVINGDGQLGEGSQWFKESEIIKKDFPEKTGLSRDHIVVLDDVSAVSAEASMFYPKLSGLTGFNRTIIWIKKAGFLIVDKMAVSSPSNIERPFHSDFKITQAEAGRFEFQSDARVVGTLKNLYPEITDVVIRKEPAEYKKEKYGKSGDRLVLGHRLQKSGYGVSFISLTDSPASVTADPDGLKVVVSGSPVYELTLRGEKGLLTKEGLSSDAEWALKTDDDWVFFQATHIEHGDLKIWSSQDTKNLSFHYDAKSSGLLPKVEEMVFKN